MIAIFIVSVPPAALWRPVDRQAPPRVPESRAHEGESAIAKIYTRTGDGGEASLFTGERIAKDAPHMEALGAVDELVAALGLARAEAEDAELAATLASLQTELYLLMAGLAAPLTDAPSDPIEAAMVTRLERMIDETDAQLPPLKDFVMPGAGRLSAQLHLARTICRRAERRIVALVRSAPVAEGALAYMNRLSDLLFVLARWADHAEGRPEATFKSGLKA